MHRYRSRRRLRPDVSVALDNLTPTHGTNVPQLVRQKSRTKRTSRSRSGSPREPLLALTPSALWNSLPLRLQIIVFAVGFLSLYYFLFGRHQKNDNRSRKMMEIHRDLEDILRKANESGFIGQNLVEAVLPDVFQEVDDSSSHSNGTQIESSVDTTEVKTSGTGKSLNSTTDPSQGERPERNNTNRRKKRKKKKKRKKRQKSVAESKEADSPTKPPDKESSHNDASESNATHVLPANEDSTSSEALLQSHNETVPTETTNTGTKAPGSARLRKTTTENTSQESTANASYPRPAGTTSTNAAEPANIIDTHTPNSDVTTAREAPSTSAQTRFPPEFEELVSTYIPKGSIPLLNWNTEAVMNESIPEQIFGLGDRHDHIAVYKPLCLDTSSGEGILFEGRTVCSGFNRTEGWLSQYCSAMKSAMHKEYLLHVQPDRKSKTWLEENAGSIEWVTGLTLLQVLERNCGNIAHFAGRALLLQHIIENAGSYAAPPSDIANILILPTFHIMKRFLHPHTYVHWHKSLVRSIVAPAKYEIGDLGNFLYRSTKTRKSNEPLVQLLHNFSVANSQFAGKKYVCFKRALIPGYMKGRFFVNDIEYPSVKPSLQCHLKDAPSIPRDSLRLRERVSALVDQTPEFKTRQKEIIFIDRRGNRRIFDEARKPDIMKAFEQVAKKHGYSFKVISFEKISFDEQYKAVKSVSIAIGIHGANLVNTIFMPPLAVLIELFPYGFVHEMYRNGGNAGLKYYSYQMSTGEKFEGPKVYRSPEQCVRLNEKCKVHYRDSTLKVTDEDIANMTTILEDAVAWCDKLPAPSKYSAEPARRRRRLLRQLLDAAKRRER